MIMTFDEYDAMLEKFEKTEVPTCWPTLEQMEMFEEDPEKWIPFLSYLYEKGTPPSNNDEKYRKRSVNLFLTKYLELVDEKDE